MDGSWLAWRQTNQLQAHILRQPQHDIHILHSLARGALDQVVYGRHYHHRIPLLGHGNGNLAAVGALHRACLGKHPRWQHIDKRFICIPGLI